MNATSTSVSFTRKAQALTAIENILTELNNEYGCTYSIQTAVNSRRSNDLSSLNRDYERFTAELNRAKAQKARDEYFATPGGAARKAELEKKLEGNHLCRQIEYNLYVAMLNSIANQFDIRLKVSNTGYDSIELGVYDRFNDKFVFGQNITVSYRAAFGESEEKLRFNVGSTGEFDANDTDYQFSRTNFYILLGRMLADAEFKNSVCKIMTDHFAEDEKLGLEEIAIKRELENPVAA